MSLQAIFAIRRNGSFIKYHSMKLKLALSAFLFVLTIHAIGQQNHNWDSWAWLMGEWKGEGGGQPGQGNGAFSFTTDLDQKVLIRKAHSEYPATESKPKVVHDDLMVIYADTGSKPTKAIYFDNEGHTINYDISYTEKTIVLISAKLPGVPVFRLTYTLLEKESVGIKFEMSMDGEKFMTYVEGKSVRVK